MKIQNKQVLSDEDLKKIVELNESVKGTSNYMRFTMEHSYKHDDTPKGGFTNWKFLGFGYPMNDIEYHFHMVGQSIYIETLPRRNAYGHLEVERFYVTKTIMEEMGWWI